MRSPFYITSGVTFDDLFSGKITPEKCYEQQMVTWLFGPASKLTVQEAGRDAGIALLTLQLMFFEHHAQYLVGEDSDRQSKKFFTIGFAEFLKHLKKKNLVYSGFAEKDIADLYKFGRCGLMHSLTLKSNVLINALGIGGKVIDWFPNRSVWLIDPNRMLPELVSYFIDYLAEIKSDKQGDLAMNFQKAFKRLVEEPGKQLLGI